MARDHAVILPPTTLGVASGLRHTRFVHSRVSTASSTSYHASAMPKLFCGPDSRHMAYALGVLHHEILNLSRSLEHFKDTCFTRQMMLVASAISKPRDHIKLDFFVMITTTTDLAAPQPPQLKFLMASKHNFTCPRVT